ncbi:MAG: phosphatidate cytidylyltransferase [Alphaproteobacteria bacterium]|nr:phosphatidate cytidylyltransferase [Alphaproteobacteria bacterium]
MSRFDLSSLRQRIFSAIILIPAVLWAIWTGQTAFAAMLLIGAAITLYEWSAMARKLPRPSLYFSLGLVYIAISYCSYYLLREQYSFEYTMACMVLVWASDSGAYFAGKTIGGPKLAIGISPNKTWAGFFGALLTPAVVAVIWLLAHNALSPSPSMPAIIYIAGFLTGALMGAIGQGGDLLISMMKRKSGVKDSGNLIPGHGGLLDRIDSLMPNAVIFYLIIKAVDYAY